MAYPNAITTLAQQPFQRHRCSTNTGVAHNTNLASDSLMYQGTGGTLNIDEETH